MSRRRSFISRCRWWLTTLFILGSAVSFGQEMPLWKQQRMHEDATGWRRLIPSHIQVQYAGGMGIASVGHGWDYGRHNQFETDWQIGYLPKSYSDRNHAIFTLKQNWIPWNIRCHERLGVEPFSCGLYFTTITGPRDIYWNTEPAKYGGAYYRFLTRVRAYIYFGQRVTWYVKRPESPFRNITLYYEMSAKDLDVVAKFCNRQLYLSDVFYFSVGLKVGLNL